MATPLESLLIGRTLVGRYAVEGVIGRGGMGLVYRARDVRLDRPVALKVLGFPPELDVGERGLLRERLRREAAAAARLSPHPNVVQVYDYGTDPALDLDFIAMELLPGTDLKAVLRERALGVDEALAVVRAAARGVAAGHRAGIVHRDVKPANVFLVRHDGEPDPVGVKVLDFGIAKALEGEGDGELTLHDVVPHSPGYASPEQLRPDVALTPASDVFQLGLVAFEALTGDRPFTDEDRARLRRGERVPLRRTERWAAAPATVREAIERALAVRPEDRFPDARAFADALTDDRTVAAPPTLDPLAGPSAGARDETVWMGEGGRPRSARPRPNPNRLVPLAVGGAAILLVGWLVLDPARRADGAAGAGAEAGAEAGEPAAEAEVASPATDGLDRDALDDEFRSLLLDAYRNLRDDASAVEGEAAAAAVQETIYDLQAAWVDGDLDRLLGHYAERVEIDGETTSRDRIEAERAELIERYEDREVTIPRLAIEFVEPGRARALVDRSWSYSGEEAGIWEGSGRDEMVLRKEGDRWLIVAERQLELFEEDRRS